MYKSKLSRIELVDSIIKLEKKIKEQVKLEKEGHEINKEELTKLFKQLNHLNIELEYVEVGI